MWWPTQCEEVRADEDEEEVGIEERTLPYVPIETDGLKEARQQDPEHESDGHAEQQRREEHAGEVDLADHDAGIHAGARSNSAMRSPASERIARVTGLLFWLSRLGHSWLSASSTRASSRGDGCAASNSLRNCSSRSEEHTSELQSLMRNSA